MPAQKREYRTNWSSGGRKNKMSNNNATTDKTGPASDTIKLHETNKNGAAQDKPSGCGPCRKRRSSKSSASSSEQPPNAQPLQPSLQRQAEAEAEAAKRKAAENANLLEKTKSITSTHTVKSITVPTNAAKSMTSTNSAKPAAFDVAPNSIPTEPLPVKEPRLQATSHVSALTGCTDVISMPGYTGGGAKGTQSVLTGCTDVISVSGFNNNPNAAKCTHSDASNLKGVAAQRCPLPGCTEMCTMEESVLSLVLKHDAKCCNSNKSVLSGCTDVISMTGVNGGGGGGGSGGAGKAAASHQSILTGCTDVISVPGFTPTAKCNHSHPSVPKGVAAQPCPLPGCNEMCTIEESMLSLVLKDDATGRSNGGGNQAVTIVKNRNILQTTNPPFVSTNSSVVRPSPVVQIPTQQLPSSSQQQNNTNDVERIEKLSYKSSGTIGHEPADALTVPVAKAGSSAHQIRRNSGSKLRPDSSTADASKPFYSASSKVNVPGGGSGAAQQTHLKLASDGGFDAQNSTVKATSTAALKYNSLTIPTNLLSSTSSATSTSSAAEEKRRRKTDERFKRHLLHLRYSIQDQPLPTSRINAPQTSSSVQHGLQKNNNTLNNANQVVNSQKTNLPPSVSTAEPLKTHSPRRGNSEEEFVTNANHSHAVAVCIMPAILPSVSLDDDIPPPDDAGATFTFSTIVNDIPAAEICRKFTAFLRLFCDESISTYRSNTNGRNSNAAKKSRLCFTPEKFRFNTSQLDQQARRVCNENLNKAAPSNDQFLVHRCQCCAANTRQPNTEVDVANEEEVEDEELVAVKNDVSFDSIYECKFGNHHWPSPKVNRRNPEQNYSQRRHVRSRKSYIVYKAQPADAELRIRLERLSSSNALYYVKKYCRSNEDEID